MQITNNSNFPRLRHCTMIGDPTSVNLTLVVGTEQFELALEAGTMQMFLTMKRYFDGRHSVREIATASGVCIQEVREIIESFGTMGLLRITPFESTIDVKEYIAKVDDTSRMWSRQIGYHRLFREFNDRILPRDVFVGYLIETWQYVRMMSAHVQAAISACDNPRWRSILEAYLEEESGHEKLLEKGLIALGFTSSEILNAHPVIGTRSLINMLADVGKKSTLSYLTCITLFEASPADALDAEADFKRIASSYDIPIEVITPFIQHLKIDVSAGHRGLLAEALQEGSDLNIEDVNAAINDMHDVKHAFDQHHDQIIQYYSDISNYIPRVKVDWFSL